ncbi:MAG: RdgB/HAM1 family non-canonical purine NTP pyrophosphatase [Dehalococcoidia bacterium]
MPRFLLATHNQGKVGEYRLLLGGLPFELLSLKELGIQEVAAEDGSTLEENARAKAEGYAALSQLLTLAEDSGLEVDALGGEPGVRSARYAGDNASDEELVRYLLDRLEGVPWERRTARFRCAIALAAPGRETEQFVGQCLGFIALKPQGEKGFGYDPIFYLPELGKTMAQLPLETKNQISHRARAAHQACRRLEQLRPEVIHP